MSNEEKSVKKAEEIAKLIQEEISNKFLYEKLDERTIESFKQDVRSVCMARLQNDVVPIINIHELKNGIISIENFRVDGKLLFEVKEDSLC